MACIIHSWFYSVAYDFTHVFVHVPMYLYTIIASRARYKVHTLIMLQLHTQQDHIKIISDVGMYVCS